MRKRLAHGLVGAALVGSVVGLGTGCRLDEPQATAAVARVEQQTALMQIAETRCEVEQRCGRVGGESRFTDPDACVAGVQQSGPVANEACAQGVDRAALAACVAELQSCRCDQPDTTIESLAECQVSNLCK